MAACIKEGFGGRMQITTYTPEECSSQGGYIVLTSQEYGELSTWWPPLTISEGATIGVAVWVAFAVAWGFRTLARQAEHSDDIGKE